MAQSIAITGVGEFSPGEPVTNPLLESILGPSVRILMGFLGVDSRHFVVDPRTGRLLEPGLGTTEMCARAAESAMARAGVVGADVDMLITASSTPEAVLPPLTYAVQRRLGLPQVQMIDIRGGCTAAIQGLMVAEAMIRSGRARCVLITAADCISPHYYVPLLSAKDPNSERVLNGLAFADGAGAVVLRAVDSRSEGMALDFVRTTSRFSERKVGFGLGSDGIAIHSHRAIRDILPQVAQCAVTELVEASGGSPDEIDTLIVPQINRSMLGIAETEEMDRKRFYIGNEIGNCPAPAIFRALNRAIDQGRIVPGQTRVGIIAIETASWLYGVSRLH